MYYQYESLADEYIFQEFLKDIFNKKFNSNAFEEYRKRGQKQFGVDVYSPLQRVAVQAKKKDLMRSDKDLKKEMLNEINETVQEISAFPHPVDQIYFTTNTKKYAELQDEAIRLSRTNNKPVFFYSWEDLQKDISIYPEIRKKYYPHLNPSVFAHELIATAKLPTNKFLKRDDILIQISNLLDNNRSVLIQSVGGAGKSTIAKMFYQQCGKQYDHVLWLEGLQNIQEDIANNQALLTGLHCEFETIDSTQKRYEIILSKILTVPGKLLIIIDDLKHDEQIRVEYEINRWLARNDTHLLVTSREQFEFEHTFALSDLSINDCNELFKQYCQKEFPENQLNKLFEVANQSPLIIQLIASTLNSSVGLSLEQLLNDFDNNELDRSELTVKFKHYSRGQVIYEKLYGQINSAFDFTNHNEYEWYLLRLLSLLPSVNLPLSELLDIFFTKKEEWPKVIEAVNSLVEKGLIIRETDEIRCHPLVLDVVQMKTTHYFIYVWIFTPLIHRLNQAYAKFLTEGLRLKFYAENIIARLKGNKTVTILQPLLLLKNNLLLTYRNFGFKKEATALVKDIENDLPFLREFAVDSNNMPTVLHNIATYYLDINDLDNAEKYELMAIEDSTEEMIDKRVQSYNSLFMLNMRKGQVEKAAEFCNEAINLLKDKPLEEYGHLLAVVYNNSAVISLAAKNPKSASNLMFLAINAHVASTNKQKQEAALPDYYANMALAFSGVGEHAKAIDVAEMAVRMRSVFNIKNDLGLKQLIENAILVFRAAGDQEKIAQYGKMLAELIPKTD